jgi:hypothetical protein
MNDTALLNRVQIAKPCPARWEEMSGDERARFCAHCNKHVYNLSAMTTAEATALIREKEGRLCARFYRRLDGTMLTADCPVGRAIARRAFTRAAARIAALASLVIAAACGKSPVRETGNIATAGIVVLRTPVTTNQHCTPLLGDTTGPVGETSVGKLRINPTK